MKFSGKQACFYVFMITGILTLAAVFFVPLIINNQITKQIPARTLLTSANNRTWGEIPGDLNITTIVNFTLFSFTNPFEVLYLNQTPEFVETKPYRYQAFSKFLNANFTNDTSDEAGQYVEFSPYQWYKPYQEVSDQDSVTVPNLGALNAWFQMKNTPREKICLDALIELADTIEKSMAIEVTAQVLWASFIQGNKSRIYDVIFYKAEVASAPYDHIWSDMQYGWAEAHSFKNWVIAAIEGVGNATSRILMEHFDLTFQQMAAILTGPLKGYISSVNIGIANYLECPTTPCAPKYIGYLQWAQEGVSSALSEYGYSPNESLFNKSNSSPWGHPEISYYLKNYFTKTVPNASIYQNVTFSVPLAARLFKRSNILHKPLQNWDILIHVGNLEWIFSIGDTYKTTRNISSFKPMVDRFRLDSVYQAHVLCAYLEYLVTDYSLQQDQNGTPELIAGGRAISKEIYSAFVNLQEFLPLHLTANWVARNMTLMRFNCEYVLNNSMNIEGSRAAAVCDSLNFTANPITTAPIKQLVNACWHQEGEAWNFLLKNTLLTKNNLLTICFDPNSVFNHLLSSAELALSKHYECNSLGDRCNKFQFAVMQWGSSNITNNVPYFLSQDLANTDSVSDWAKDIFPKPIEFVPVMNYLARVFNGVKKSGLSYAQAQKILNFDHLFNGFIVQQTFLFHKNNLVQNITALYGIEDYMPLIYYMRYMMVEVGFGGFTQTRTVKELLWGYSDSFLASIARADPIMEGGDPSVDSVIHLVNNGTIESALNTTEALYTGTGNIMKVRSFKKINGRNYITSKYHKFNGNRSYIDISNPWKMKIPLIGTDGEQNSPQMQPNDPLYIFNPELKKVLECEWDKNDTFQKNEMSVRRYRIKNSTLQSKATNQDNGAYFMDKWDGVLNLTSVKRAPVFISKLHYLHADSRLQSSVNLYKDAAKTQKISPSDQDDSYFDVEPVTGSNYGSELKLQVGYQFAGDEIYPMSFEGLFPVFTIQQGSDFMNNQTAEFFVPLKKILLVKKLILPVGLTLAGVLLLVALYLYVTYERKRFLPAGESLFWSASDLEQDTKDTLEKSSTAADLHANHPLNKRKMT